MKILYNLNVVWYRESCCNISVEKPSHRSTVAIQQHRGCGQSNLWWCRMLLLCWRYWCGLLAVAVAIAAGQQAGQQAGL